MSEHKYNDAYSKGFEAGKKQAFTGYCMQCYDELSPYEQAKLMVEWGADIPNVLDKIRAEIGKSKTEHEMQLAENDTKGRLLVSHIYCGIVSILDKYKAESEDRGMTNEEIIKGLESVKIECGKHLNEGFAWICQPIDEAIKALEQSNSDEDCISREYILSKAHCCCDDLADDEPCCVDVDDIKNAPNVQPMRPKGEWLKDEYGIYCSNCQNGIAVGYKFCPCCGADMRGK